MIKNFYTLSEGIKEIDVMNIAMLFYPNVYKELPLVVLEEDGFIRASLGEEKEEIKLSDSLSISNASKKCVYLLLKRITLKDFSWGTLTSVKPLYLIYDLLNKGYTRKKIIEHLGKNLLVSEEKINLLLETYENQKNFLTPKKDNFISLYINIPFCPSKCKYCSFPSKIVKEGDSILDVYLEKLFLELDFLNETIVNNNLYIDNIYIGGGTPSILNEKQLALLLNKINLSLNLSNLEEFSFEAGRIDTITKEKLSILKEMNVSRISINPQSTIEKNLLFMGRENSFNEFKSVFELAKKYNFNSINSDLIMGFPNQTNNDFLLDLENLTNLEPNNITIHTLYIKRVSLLETSLIKDEEKFISSSHKMAKDFLKEKGYYPYYLYKQKFSQGDGENIGYCRENKEGIYNIRIMGQKQTILSIGAGSTGRIFTKATNQLTRVETIKDIPLYISNIDEVIKKKRKIYTNKL